jgi:hypothetical protein
LSHKKRKYLLFLGIFLSAGIAEGQFIYRTQYTSALMVEGFGISPIVSANYEWAPIRLNKSFYVARIGFGFIPGERGTGSGFSIPVQTSYVFKLPKLVSDYMRSLNTFPPKLRFESFIETGVGGARIIYPGKDQRNYYNLFLGFRQQLLIDTPPKPRIIYARIGINPRVNRKGLVFFENNANGGQNFFGGIALGVSL